MVLRKRSAYDAAGIDIRSARGTKRKSAAYGGAARKAIRSERHSKKGWTLMRLHIVRGCSFSAAEGDDCPMDEAVWGKMPEKIMWEVLRFVPVAKHFQLQSVSRKWRQVLTSNEFRGTLLTAASLMRGPALRAHTQGQAARVDAFVSRTSLRAARDHDDVDDDDCSSSSRSTARDMAAGAATDWCSSLLPTRKAKVVDIDLSAFVPSWFWHPDRRYKVVAAAGSLVCISNNSDDRRHRGLQQQQQQSEAAAAPGPSTNRYCVLNSLTRTCLVLPEVPFRHHRWLSPTHNAVTILRDDFRAAEVATYDLAASSQWAVATQRCVSPLLGDDDSIALWGGRIYGCGRQTFFAQRDTSADPLEVLAPGSRWSLMAAPPVARLRRDSRGLGFCEYGLGLVAHRGALFYAAQLIRWHAYGQPRCPCNPPVACAVWRLAAGGDGYHKEWVAVARLMQEVNRLMALRYGSLRWQVDFTAAGEDFKRFHAYGVRELLCCSLVRLCVHVNGSYRRLLVLLGFNLDTGDWELVHELEQPAVRPAKRSEEWMRKVLADCEKPVGTVMSAIVELRPDLFLS